MAQTKPALSQSPYGGVTVEDIVAHVNDQIITQSDYDRAMKEIDDEAKQHGATMQQISEQHKDLLRSLIDQQLWLSKAKEMGITGDTELIKRLDEIRKQYNLETMQDLEKAAKDQGFSYEDFKANIRNQIVTQEVMREEVGRRVSITPGETQRFFEAHKQDYVRPENIQLSEILVSTGDNPDDQTKTAAGKAKADDIEAKLHAGGDFGQLARSFSDGTTASEGGSFGTFKKGELAPVFEDAVYGLKAGQYSDPIRTKQGYIIFKVEAHNPGGVPAFTDVREDVEQNYYESRMMPAMRDYLTEMREEAYIDIKPQYTDTGASPKEIKPVYSTYAPPTTKKKKKIERTRFRETTHSFRQKSEQSAAPVSAAPVSAATATKKNASATVQKPGKKERIRYGQAPSKTLPNAESTATEDAGATAPTANATVSAAAEPENPLEASAKQVPKTRLSARPKTEKKAKLTGPSADPSTPPAPDAAEVADKQQQAAPLGLNGDTSKNKKKKKTATTTEEKTRLTDEKKKPADATPDSTATPAPPAAPVPAPTTPTAPQQ